MRVRSCRPKEVGSVTSTKKSTPWRVATGAVLWKRLRWAIAVGLATGAVAVLAGLDSVGVLVTLVIAAFVISALVIRFVEVVATRPEGVLGASRKVVANDPGYWGGQVAHLGIALVAIALATTSGLAIREVVRIDQGESAVVGGFCLSYLGPFESVERHRTVSGAKVLVLDKSCSTEKALLRPSVNNYPGVAQPIGTPEVWTSFSTDVYVGLAGGSVESVLLNVFIFPYQWLLWFGGLVVVAGGGLAMRRKPARRRATSDLVTAQEPNSRETGDE